MAGRPPKEGIDFAGWDVNIFDNDRKIDKLLDAQGCTGFVTYFYLCQRAYGSHGYYFPWSYDDAATTAKKIGGGAGSDAVINTVNLCFRIGLFDKDLYDRHEIITSRGIQKRYMAVALSRTNKSVISEYWLLSDEESGGLVKVAISQDEKRIMPPHNSIIPPYNTHFSDSKVKESKEESFLSPETADEKKYSDDSREMKLALLLSSEIKNNNPSWIMRGGVQSWCDTFRLMLDRDRRDYGDIAKMIKFTQWDEFWKTNILSPAKLRKQYDMLTLKREEARKKIEQQRNR